MSPSNKIFKFAVLTLAFALVIALDVLDLFVSIQPALIVFCLAPVFLYYHDSKGLLYVS